MTLEYINQQYKTSFKKGQKVRVNGRDGVITGTRNAYILVRFDGKSHPNACHPEWLCCVVSEIKASSTPDPSRDL